MAAAKKVQKKVRTKKRKLKNGEDILDVKLVILIEKLRNPKKEPKKRRKK